MSVFHIAVCDDEAPMREKIASLVTGWARERSHDISLSQFSSSESFLFHYEEKAEFDILLLDIEMGEMNGIDLAKKLRQKDKRLQIIFLTGYSEYISEGYEVAALHYLLKPIRPEKLFATLDRAAENLKTAARTLTVVTAEETVLLPLSEIRYAEVLRNYTTIHAEEDYTVKMPLQELEKSLDESFFRVGRSYLVNLRRISRITRSEILLRTGESIPLPRRSYEAANRALIELR